MIHDAARGRITFTGVLVTTMMAATFTAVAFGILAQFLIDDFDISRAQVGGLVTAVGVVAAILSPFVGRLTDGIGGRRALIVLLVFSFLGLLGVALAPIYGLLLVAGGLAGVAQALGNPATNKLIAQVIPQGRRGVITGLKQSGVQLGIFLGGVLLPVGALSIGWRPTIAMVALLPACILVVAFFVVPPHADSGGASKQRLLERHPPGTWWLTLYSLGMGAAAGSLMTFLPLYAHEEMGLTERQAGLVIGLVGLVALITRILWGPLSERARHYGAPLAVLAGVAAVSVVALLLAPSVGVTLLWVGAVLMAASSGSWNSVAMLAVMHEAGPGRAGSASGIVLFGFMTGLGIGPLVFGYSVDTTGAYTIGLWALVILCLTSMVVALSWLNRSRYVVLQLK